MIKIGKRMTISHTYKQGHLGFTLAELLIALAILGIIATFTIPKILMAQQSAEYKAKAKEAAGMIAAAYASYSSQNTASASTKIADLTSYMNFVRIDATASSIDDKQTLGSTTCNAGGGGGCLVLHNGGRIRYSNDGFGGTASTNAVEFYFDPNGSYGGTTNGPDKSVQLFLYYNGRMSTRGTSAANTVASGVTYASADPSFDPPWFSWE